VRTTLSLDEDVASLLNKEMRRSGKSFKEVVNHFLRLGLLAPKQPNRKPFVVTPRPLGLPPGLSYDNVEELIEALEGPAHK
jgi:hypothetical protein